MKDLLRIFCLNCLRRGVPTVQDAINHVVEVRCIFIVGLLRWEVWQRHDCSSNRGYLFHGHRPVVPIHLNTVEIRVRRSLRQWMSPNRSYPQFLRMDVRHLCGWRNAGWFEDVAAPDSVEKQLS